MLKKSFLIAALTLALAGVGLAQNANTSTQTRRRSTSTTTTTTTRSTGVEEQGAAETQGANTNAPAGGNRRASRGRRAGQRNEDPASTPRAAFDALVEGIRNADVDEVTRVYWNSPQLLLFNNNGTVTRGWRQMRENRERSYPNYKDVRLDVRDVRVQPIGRDAAVVTCLWTQSQTFRGTPETASGRMTLVFRRFGTTWRAVHLHTSPDAPDPSRVLPSEQQTTTTDETTTTPATTTRPRTTPGTTTPRTGRP